MNGSRSSAGPIYLEIFGDSDSNNGVVGTDLLLHPGQVGNADEFVIARYTVGDDSLFTAGTGEISGSFRELVIGGGGSAQSVSVAVFQNAVSLFSTAGGTDAQELPVHCWKQPEPSL